jgi:hypothetical protein
MQRQVAENTHKMRWPSTHCLRYIEAAGGNDNERGWTGTEWKYWGTDVVGVVLRIGEGVGGMR